MKIEVKHFASATSPLKLANPVEVNRQGVPVEAGQLVVVRALTENPLYPELETPSGERVAVKKGDGIACLKDTIRMKNAGAVKTLSFLDCGVPSTVDTDDIAGIARSIMSQMKDVDIVVMELGDGIMGHYKVDRFFDDRALMSHIDAVVFCASDLTAAWGSKEILAQRGIGVTVVCGPATDTEAGVTYLEKTIGVPAANALTDSQKLLSLLSPVLAHD